MFKCIFFTILIFNATLGFSNEKCWEKVPCDCKENWWCKAYEKQDIKTSPPKFYEIAFFPGILSPGNLTSVEFRLKMAGDFREKPKSIEVYDQTRKLIVSLKDNGVYPDRTKGDYSYGGKLEISTANKVHGDCFQFTAKSNGIKSPPTKLCVSSFLNRTINRDIKPIKSPEGNFYDSGSIIFFTKGIVSAEKIYDLEKRHKGKISQSIDLQTYVFYFNRPAKNFSILKKRQQLINRETFIKSTELNGIGSGSI